MLEGEYGYKNIVTGVPVKLGKNGIEKIIEVDLNDQQKNNLSKSITKTKQLVKIMNKTN